MTFCRTGRTEPLQEPFSCGTKKHLDHIYAAKTDETKVRRIADLLDKLNAQA